MSILNKDKILAQAKKLISQGKYDAAIKEYDKVLTVDPDDMRVKIRIAELYAKQKRINEAIKVYRQVAESYEKDGFYLKAVTVYKSILRLNPSLMEVNKSLAEIYEQMGLSKDALYQYQILASSYEQKGLVDKALEVRRRLVELEPSEVTLRLRLAELYQWEGQEQESLDEYERVAEQYRAEGKIDRAIDLYEKILAHRPDNFDMIRELVLIYRKRGELKKAVKYLESHPDMLQGDPYLINILAEMYARLNQVESAKERYRELADLYLTRSEMDAALEAYKQVLVLDPQAEEEISPMVESIRPGAMETIIDGAKRRKEQLEEQEKRRTELDRRRQTMEESGVSTQKSASSKLHKVPQKSEASLSEEDMGRMYRDAKTSIDLGKMYLKTGLDKEGEAELQKALNVLKEISSNDITYRDVEKIISDVEAAIGFNGKEEGRKGFEDESGPVPKKVEEKKEKVIEKETRTTTETTPKSAGSKPGKPKSKISFV
ncbi:tetratricopeptide repeat protein [bacterium]|nr:tetratricopeptide repeat protein [bacterium]